MLKRSCLPSLLLHYQPLSLCTNTLPLSHSTVLKTFVCSVLPLALRSHEMSTSAQARLDRLFRNKPKPQVQNATDQQAFWEKELIGSQQQEQSDPPIEAERLSIQQGRTQTLSQSEHTSSSNQDTPDRSADPTNGHAFIVEPTQAVYLPNGKNQWQPPTAGLGNIQIDDGPEVEPGSSSTKLIGQFCIFSQVAKFPYKYMSDPGSIVSRRFFAAEKVYERNWKM